MRYEYRTLCMNILVLIPAPIHHSSEQDRCSYCDHDASDGCFSVEGFHSGARSRAGISGRIRTHACPVARSTASEERAHAASCARKRCRCWYRCRCRCCCRCWCWRYAEDHPDSGGPGALACASASRGGRCSHAGVRRRCGRAAPRALLGTCGAPGLRSRLQTFYSQVKAFEYNLLL